RSAGGLRPLVTSIGGLLRNRTYVGYTLTTGFSFMVLFGYISASPFVFQSILGLSPAAYSIAFGLNAIGIVMVGATSAKLVGRISPRRLASVGIGAILIGALCTLGAVLAQASAWVMLPCLFVTVASVGMILGNTSALAISEAPRSAGTASALLGALQFCLGAIASPLVGLAGEDSALPMALVMVAAGLLALTCFTLLARDGAPRPAESEAV
ncbi:MAG: MFS transporter, partial [Pseudodonghicola sp.]